MIIKGIGAALLSTALWAGAAQAQEVVEWWDFLSGGDGVRMKALIDRFNQEHAGEIEIQATTLEWGVPFYTKVQTSAAVGEGPDVMTYHLSRMPLGVESGVLSPITEEDLAAAGLAKTDFAERAVGAASFDGTFYAVPFDISSIVLYYNKELLGAAGLLDENGLPTGIEGAENFTAALQTLKDAGAEYGVSFGSADGPTDWRIFYSLLGQQGGQFLDENGEFLSGDNLDKAVRATEFMTSWVASGLAPSQIEYPASIALFTGGNAAMHLNGAWEVPTMTDLHAQGELFDWGAVQLPVFFDQPATWADSHAFAIPQNQGNEMTPEKRAAVMEVIGWMARNSNFWATAGHLPAFNAARNSEELRTLQPYATFSVLADTAVYDPISPLTGVASPTYDAAGNYLMPAVNGEISAQEAMESMRDDLQGQASY
jgi:multiple sugar transport system substrate-binding protein